MRIALGVLVAVASFPFAVAGQAPAAGPTFDVVSVKPHGAGGDAVLAGAMMNQRPDGGLIMSRVPIALILAFAFQPIPTADMVGLPDWARREVYDITATASLANPTLADRTAMLRALLADRFRLLAHHERREVPSFDLVVARNDGKLGPGLVKSETDCEAVLAARRTEAEEAARSGAPLPPPQRFDPNSPPPCFLGAMPNGIRGEVALISLASMLRTPAGRLVVDKTGLSGTYRVNLTLDFSPTLRGPGAPPPSGDVPSVFTAVREQLGLRLEPSRTERDVLVIDRLERPTEN
jgi:uncharacterized protein (TIGR03435 family)